MSRTTLKTLILKRNGKRRVVKLLERNNMSEQLTACQNIAKHSKMPIKQIRYK